MTKDHRGTYYCVATNVVGQGSRRNVDVEGTLFEIRQKLIFNGLSSQFSFEQALKSILYNLTLFFPVEFSPVLRIPRRRLGQALQFDMDLECHIEAYPPPAIRWFDGESRLITNNQHFRISHFTFDDEYVNTILRHVIFIYISHYQI